MRAAGREPGNSAGLLHVSANEGIRPSSHTAPMDLVRGDIHDLDDQSLADLVRIGEPAHVERKKQMPEREKLAATVAAMANGNGGWLVLGVEDSGAVCGMSPGRMDLAAHVRQLISPSIDPVPNFNARWLPYRGVQIGVIRVYESFETPHLTGDGRVLIHEAGGNRPVAQRAELDALIARGSAGTDDATGRLSSPLLAEFFGADELTGARTYDRSLHREWILRVSPFALDDGFARRASAKEAVTAADRGVTSLLSTVYASPVADEWTDRVPVAGGWGVRRERVGDAAMTSVVVDPTGTIGLSVRERGQRSVINLDKLVAETILPMVEAALTLLREFGVAGRVTADLHARGFKDVNLQTLGDSVHLDGRTLASRQRHSVPAVASADAVQGIATEMVFDLGRSAGLSAFH